MQTIFLIGYMGSGKTTIGRCLAQELGLQFIDLDLFIENRYRKKIRDIFAEMGETDFRIMERNALREIAGFENTLVSTGGGTPCFFDNMELMNRSGRTVYLKVSVNELAKRLHGGKQHRPLLAGKTPEELKSFIVENLALREPCYNQAQIRTDSFCLDTSCELDMIVGKLSTCLKQMNDYECEAN